MKNRNSFKLKFNGVLGALVIVFLFSIAANAQESTSFRLLTPGLAAQGQSFTGTIVEETENGPIPLMEGSKISVMGEVVEVGKKGKVEIPACPDISGTYPIGASVISIHGASATTTQSTIASEPVTFIPVFDNATPVTEIWSASDIVGPGKVITVKGTNLKSLTNEVLIGNNGETLELTELSSSFFESQYVVAGGDFPQGEYHFSAEDHMGYMYISENVSLNPTFEMTGPALKKVGQKGKIRIKTNGDGVITVSGGMPVIELHPTGDMNVFNSDIGTTFMFPSQAGEEMVIPFTAQQVGQYTVTADLHSEGNLPDEFLGEPVSVNPQPIETEFDPVTNETTVFSSVEVLADDGSPIANTTVESILSNPVQPELITVATNSSGIADIRTSIPGNFSGNDISFTIINVIGHSILQEGQNLQDGDCNNPEPVQDGTEDPLFDESYADILRENKATWGNYQGICGTGLMEMARNHPQAYADFLETEKQIEDWLNGLANQEGNNENEGDADGDKIELTDEMIKIYEANKNRWGNYQGICGTALMEMARNYPQLYQDFLDNEQRIADLIKSHNNQNQDENGESGSGGNGTTKDCEMPWPFEDMSDEMKASWIEMLEMNKKMWGNYSGICGTGLMEMMRTDPEWYDSFLESEKQIEDYLKKCRKK